MEQNVVDASKYKISLVSLDTRFAQQKNGANSEFRIDSPIVLRNVIRVRLVSVELPLVEYTFTEAKGNVSFLVYLAANPNPFTLPNIRDGNYNALSLCSAIDARLKTISSGFTCSLNTSTGLIEIKHSTMPFKLDVLSQNPNTANRPTHWGLGYYLGFRSRYITSIDEITGIYEVHGTSVMNVQPTPYYLLQLRCPDQVVNLTHPTADSGYVEAFAKIILRDNYYTIQFDDNSNLMRKEYTFLAPVTVPFFNIKLLDPWGSAVNMLDADWSLTLEFTEIVNSKTYTTISKTYQRL